MHIAFGGEAEHGKSSCAKHAANFLSKRYRINTQTIGFADPIKRSAMDIFRLKPVDVYTSEGKAAPQPKLGPKATSRIVLQKMGTEMFRDKLTEIIPELETFESTSIWVWNLEESLREAQHKNIYSVIHDLRFPDEEKMLRNHNVVCVKVVRPGHKTTVNKSHASETAGDLIKFDHVVTNDGTLDDLNKKIEDIITQHMGNFKVVETPAQDTTREGYLQKIAGVALERTISQISRKEIADERMYDYRTLYDILSDFSLGLGIKKRSLYFTKNEQQLLSRIHYIINEALLFIDDQNLISAIAVLENLDNIGSVVNKQSYKNIIIEHTIDNVNKINNKELDKLRMLLTELKALSDTPSAIASIDDESEDQQLDEDEITDEEAAQQLPDIYEDALKNFKELEQRLGPDHPDTKKANLVMRAVKFFTPQ